MCIFSITDSDTIVNRPYFEKRLSIGGSLICGYGTSKGYCLFLRAKSNLPTPPHHHQSEVWCIQRKGNGRKWSQVAWQRSERNGGGLGKEPQGIPVELPLESAHSGWGNLSARQVGSVACSLEQKQISGLKHIYLNLAVTSLARGRYSPSCLKWWWQHVVLKMCVAQGFFLLS